MKKKWTAIITACILTLSASGNPFAAESKAEEPGFFTQLGALADSILSDVGEDLQEDLDEFLNSEEVNNALNELSENLDLIGEYLSEDRLEEYWNGFLENIHAEDLQKLYKTFAEDAENLRHLADTFLNEDGPVQHTMEALAEQGGSVADLINSLRREDGHFDTDKVLQLGAALAEADLTSGTFEFNGVVVTSTEVRAAIDEAKVLLEEYSEAEEAETEAEAEAEAETGAH